MKSFGFWTRALAAPIVISLGCESAAPVSPTTPDYSATPVFGGRGGGSFLAYCPRDTYLVGISGRHGDWIDAIQPICAKWNDAAQAFSAPVRGPVTGGSGGGEATLGRVGRPAVYAQRSSAGLIITEGTSPSPNGLGYARIPGLLRPKGATG